MFLFWPTVNGYNIHKVLCSPRNLHGKFRLMAASEKARADAFDRSPDLLPPDRKLQRCPTL
eukprot:1195751-Prorocentrum_minimum.AAC.2